LVDGTYGLGHIVSYPGLAICAFFGDRARTLTDLTEGIDRKAQHPIAILTVTDCELRSGEWPAICFREPRYPASWIPKYMCEGAMSCTSGVAIELLEAYHGLIPWDMDADPKENEKLLLPGVDVPETVRYMRDFPPEELARLLARYVSSEDLGYYLTLKGLSSDAALARCLARDGLLPAGKATSTEVTEGPAEIHIQILYPGNDLPTVEQLRKRHALEHRLEQAGAGEVTDAGGGEGVMDVFLATDAVERAMPIVEQALAELGIKDDALIETAPLDDEDDDENDDEDDDENVHDDDAET
jgi:hypothetical protein